MTTDRFNVDDFYYWSFGGEFLVVCPKCSACAKVLDFSGQPDPTIRLSCLHCSHSKDWEQLRPGVTFASSSALFDPGVISIGSAVDWYFHEPLWLQEACCGRNLWAYNSKHLHWLRDFVGAKLRERTISPEHGWSNQSLASRLPKWFQEKSNREAILAALKRMEQRLE